MKPVKRPLKPSDPEQALAEFASRGFLLVDSLPFAEAYSNGRSRDGYRQLVESCSSFVLEKINNDGIGWSDDVKVALAFKLNGQAVVGSFPDGIQLRTGQRLTLSEELISADGSGYTNPERLRAVFDVIPVGSD